MMEYFLDCADEAVIRTALDYYPLDGVTTNPGILSRDLPEGVSLRDGLVSLRKLTRGYTLFVQTTAATADGIVSDAHKVCELLGGKLSIKIPTTPEGLKAMRILSREGVCITATAIYTSSQAILAAKAGAYYVAPYITHIDNLSLDGASVAIDIAKELREHEMETVVLAASFRTAEQVDKVIRGGVGAVTVTADLLAMLASHPGTSQDLARFDEKWEKRFGKGISELL